MKFDKYSRVARIYPTVISIIPLIFLSVFLTNTEFAKLTNSLSLKILGNIGIASVLMYLIAIINRFFGKEIFENKIFKNETFMPTTSFLLFKNKEFTKNYKLKIRGLIIADFRLNLPDENDELSDELEARKSILEAVGLIRKKVGEGTLVIKRLTEYGFVRNLVGGSIVGIITSIFNCIFFYYSNSSKFILVFSLLLLLFFVILLVFSKLLIVRHGKLYAKQLFIEYIALHDKK